MDLFMIPFMVAWSLACYGIWVLLYTRVIWYTLIPDQVRKNLSILLYTLFTSSSRHSLASTKDIFSACFFTLLKFCVNGYKSCVYSNVQSSTISTVSPNFDNSNPFAYMIKPFLFSGSFVNCTRSPVDGVDYVFAKDTSAKSYILLLWWYIGYTTPLIRSFMVHTLTPG